MNVDALPRDVRGERDLPNWTSVIGVLQAVSDAHVATAVVLLREEGDPVIEGAPALAIEHRDALDVRRQALRHVEPIARSTGRASRL